jgi:hypothetical protein
MFKKRKQKKSDFILRKYLFTAYFCFRVFYLNHILKSTYITASFLTFFSLNCQNMIRNPNLNLSLIAHLYRKKKIRTYLIVKAGKIKLKIRITMWLQFRKRIYSSLLELEVEKGIGVTSAQFCCFLWIWVFCMKFCGVCPVY